MVLGFIGLRDWCLSRAASYLERIKDSLALDTTPFLVGTLPTLGGVQGFRV